MMANANQDTNQLLNIFPPEVWQLILRVTDAKTFQILRSSLSFFASLTNAMRSHVLFPGVVDHVISRLLKSGFYFSTGISTTINCRAVCRAWKQGVDSFLENPEPHLQLPANNPYDKYPKHLHYFLNNFFSAKNFPQDARQFYRHFSTSHTVSNPFVSRNVSITLDDMRDNPEFPEEMNRVLERWGHHIWFVYFRITHPTSDSYLRFNRFLNLLPNLKVLNVMVFIDGNQNNSEISVENLAPSNHHPKLKCVKTYGLSGYVWDQFKAANLHVAEVNVVTPEEIIRTRRQQGSNPRSQETPYYICKEPREIMDRLRARIRAYRRRMDNLEGNDESDFFQSSRIHRGRW